jgi:hypothetical protein
MYLWKSALFGGWVAWNGVPFSFCFQFNLVVYILDSLVYAHILSAALWCLTFTDALLDCTSVQSLRRMAHDVVGVLWAGESFPSGERQRQSDHHADRRSSTTNADLHFGQRFRPSAQVCDYFSFVFLLNMHNPGPCNKRKNNPVFYLVSLLVYYS